MVASAMSEKDFVKAAQLRGTSFQRNLETCLQMSKLQPKHADNDKQYSYTLAIMNVGAPACGVNSAARSFVRHGVWQGKQI